MSLKDLPTPDPKKVTRYHDNSLDALIDEALDEMEAKIKTGNFIGHCPTPRKENDNGKKEL